MAYWDKGKVGSTLGWSIRWSIGGGHDGYEMVRYLSISIKKESQKISCNQEWQDILISAWLKRDLIEDFVRHYDETCGIQPGETDLKDIDLRFNIESHQSFN